MRHKTFLIILIIFLLFLGLSFILVGLFTQYTLLKEIVLTFILCGSIILMSCPYLLIFILDDSDGV